MARERANGRGPHELRPTTIEPDFMRSATKQLKKWDRWS